MTTNLILGGTGTTGRRVAQHLRSAGHPVRTASRTGSDVRLDLDDPTTWTPALDGVTAAYLVEPTLHAGARLARFAEQAMDSGVRRLVLLSAARAEEEGHPLHAVEQTLRNSSIDWTILHPNWFAQNFSEGPWRQAILDGVLALPTGSGRTPFIDAEDIAAVAAAAMIDSRRSGEVYELTGPRPVSFGEATQLIAKATDRAIVYEDVDPDDFTKRQIEYGVTPGGAQLLTSILIAIASGEAETVTDDVNRALGRPARDFDRYVTDAATAGHWNL